MTSIPIPLLAKYVGEAPMLEGLALMVVGMVVVFAALLLVGALIGVIRIVAESEPAASVAAPPAIHESELPTEPADWEVPTEPIEPEVAAEPSEAAPAAAPYEPAAPAEPYEPAAATAVSPAAAPAEPGPAAVEEEETGEIDAETLAVISAAAAAVVGGRVRVRHVEFLRGRGGGSWAESGRVGIQTSHNLQMRNR